jgi:hypothetical protein
MSVPIRHASPPASSRPLLSYGIADQDRCEGNQIDPSRRQLTPLSMEPTGDAHLQRRKSWDGKA